MTEFKLVKRNKRPMLYVKGCDQYIYIKRGASQDAVEFWVKLDKYHKERLEWDCWIGNDVVEASEFLSALSSLCMAQRNARKKEKK